MQTESQPISSPQPPSPVTEDETPWERFRRRPFPRLLAHFIAVVMNSGQESGTSELNLGVGGMLALLATPGGFVSILMYDKYSSFLRWMHRIPTFNVFDASLPDKYFFIVFSMVVTGMVAVLKWDRILPSRQDYANLGPLPLSSRMVFIANLCAILLLATAFAIDVNMAATVLFPLGVVASVSTLGAWDYFTFCRDHAISVLAASAFVFFGCFAVMGLLMSILPNRWFRPVSMFVRLVIVALLIGLLCTSFTVPPLVRQMPKHPDSIVSYLPSVWFLGLYQGMQGASGRQLAELGVVGEKALGIVVVVALLACALSYRRYYLRIPESADHRVSERRARFGPIQALMHRTVLRTPFERAGYSFTMKALFRSETHLILFGGFAAFGLVVAWQMLLDGMTGRSAATIHARFPSDTLTEVPLALAYFLIAGLRFVFDVPATSTANWAYRAILDPDKHQARALARKVMLTFALPFVVLPSLVIYGWVWGAYIGVMHASGILVLCLLLIDVLLLNYRKLPFTCTLPAFQNHTITFLMMYVVGFVLFTQFFGGIEHWVLLSPWHLITAAILCGLAWAAIYRWRDNAAEIDRQLIFEERIRPEVERLAIDMRRF